ncbi:hypothetical protein GPL21_17350 [Bradyrhizobium pachyrhizi]|uniref:Uncharacterized protein n=1 Tax=Bradyrhizobium pachyrhizi TaxID=280333 RepID=A0A844SIP2_9BRAD|nr:hypothetical protein [Bradyrhizobium pachyrhizi]MVT66868.1 hypothetical protein [Bradyrhizobium pachyrhizi]
MKAGWGAVLRGEPTDLEDWRYVLGNEFDPRTELHGTDTILRSESFDGLETAEEVHAKALDMIDYLNGALALSQGTRPIAFGGVVRFAEDGRMHRTIFATATASVRAKMRATVEVIGKDGKPIPAVPRASEVQLWADIAEADDLFQEALMYMGKETTWFNVYKAIECLELRFGNGEAEFLRLGWAPASQIKLMKRSANTLRHSKQKFEPPEKPMTLGDATSLLHALLRRGLEAASVARESTP